MRLEVLLALAANAPIDGRSWELEYEDTPGVTTREFAQRFLATETGGMSPEATGRRVTLEPMGEPVGPIPDFSELAPPAEDTSPAPAASPAVEEMPPVEASPAPEDSPAG